MTHTATEGRKWAVLIGIDRYDVSLGALRYCTNDCRRIATVLTEGESAFSSDHILLLTDSSAETHRPTYGAMHTWLGDWLSRPEDDDTILVFFAGHGREMGGKCYLAPADATLATMHVQGIPVSHVQDLLFRCKARQKLLILDACHSGAGSRDICEMSGAMVQDVATGKGIYTITSCDAEEVSHEWEEKEHGVFSYYLAEALSGACETPLTGIVTADAVYDYVLDRVRTWAASSRRRQTPKRFCEGVGPIVIRQLGLVSLPADASPELVTARSLFDEQRFEECLGVAESGLSKQRLSYDLRKLKRDAEEQLRIKREKELAAGARRIEEHVARLLRDAEQFEKDGDIASAEGCLQEAVKYPAGAPAETWLERLQRRSKLSDPAAKAAEIKVLFKKAEDIEPTDPQTAVATYQEILKLYPGNRRAEESVLRCQEKASLASALALISRTLESTKRRHEGLLKEAAQLKKDSSEYERLAMDSEARKTTTDLEHASQNARRTGEIARFIEKAETIARKAPDLASLIEMVHANTRFRMVCQRVALGEWHTVQDVLSVLVPDMVVARKEFDSWIQECREHPQKASAAWRSVLTESRQAVVGEKKRVEEENARRKASHREKLEKERIRIEQENAKRLAEYESEIQRVKAENDRLQAKHQAETEKEKERIAGEQASLDEAFAKLPWYRRISRSVPKATPCRIPPLHLTDPQSIPKPTLLRPRQIEKPALEKAREMPKPDRAAHFALPTPPSSVVRTFGTLLLEYIPRDILDQFNTDDLRKRIRAEEKGEQPESQGEAAPRVDRTRKAAASNRSRALSGGARPQAQGRTTAAETSKPKRSGRRPSAVSIDAFVNWLVRSHHFMGPAAKRLVRVFAEVCATMLARGNAIQLKGLGTLRGTRDGRIEFDWQPATKHCSASISRGFRGRLDVDKEEISKCSRMGLMIRKFCQSSGRGVKILSLGTFFPEGKTLFFQASRSLRQGIRST